MYLSLPILQARGEITCSADSLSAYLAGNTLLGQNVILLAESLKRKDAS
jgi:hypothetical protein